MKNIFKNKIANIKKLKDFGFRQNSEGFIHSCNILGGDFCLNIRITSPNIVYTKVTEKETGEIYTLHLTDSEGDFVGKIRDEYKNILKQIADNCFDANIFKFDYTHKIIKYVKDKYNDEAEYLWEKFPDNAIVRRSDNKKWYLVILTVSKNKLGINSNEKVEVIDLRANPMDLENIIKQKNFYPGYHMNKKNWFSVILDGSVNIDKICELIDKSYNLAAKK